MSWLYEPTKESAYQLPIGDRDRIAAHIDTDWRYLMDMYVANNGRDGVSKQKLAREFESFLEMVIEDARENFDLVADKMVKEIRKEK